MKKPPTTNQTSSSWYLEFSPVSSRQASQWNINWSLLRDRNLSITRMICSKHKKTLSRSGPNEMRMPSRTVFWRKRHKWKKSLMSKSKNLWKWMPSMKIWKGSSRRWMKMKESSWWKSITSRKKFKGKPKKGSCLIRNSERWRCKRLKNLRKEYQRWMKKGNCSLSL